MALFGVPAYWGSLEPQLSSEWKFQPPHPPDIKVSDRIISGTFECKCRGLGGVFLMEI